MIQVLNRAFDILELIARDPERVVSLTEIADSLQLNHATCANIIKTMVQRNYIEQIGHKKGYRLGPMAYFISGNFSYKRDLVNAARKPMEEMTAATNENSLLATMRDNKRICLFEVMGSHDLQVRTSLEKEVYNTATGRLLLAYLTPAEQTAFAEKYGLPDQKLWPDVTSIESLRQALNQIREAGVAVQKTNAYIFGLAVPIWKDSKVVASLGLFLPEMRYTGRESEILNQMKKTAQKINETLNPISRGINYSR